MADPNRSISRWSGITRSTVETSQTAPIVAVRRKLLRQPNISPRVLLQQNNRSKHDIEQLFKLYYSNDLQFDGFQKQIVTGFPMKVSLRRFSSASRFQENEFTQCGQFYRKHDHFKTARSIILTESFTSAEKKTVETNRKVNIIRD